MPTNLTRGPRAQVVQAQDANLGNLAGASDEVYDQLWLAPQAALLHGGASQVPDSGNVSALLSFPAGSQTLAIWSLRARARWNHHQATARVVYTSAGASTATFTLNHVLRGARVGEFVPPGALGNVAASPPGPAVANTVLVETTTMPGPIGSDMEALSFVLIRSATDANAGALLVLGVLLRIYSL
jgi:hypothetical protein